MQSSSVIQLLLCLFRFFFNDTATTEIYTLSLHDALPISSTARPTRRAPTRSTTWTRACGSRSPPPTPASGEVTLRDRKSTRLNSSHDQISYAVFCLKKKKNK